MRRRALLMAALTVLLAPPLVGQVADEAAVPRITLAAFKQAADAGQVLVIDIRDTASYAAGHIPGAINVPFEQVQQKLATLRAAKQPIVAYCA